MEFEGRKKIVINLNMAPLIDIVFLLLLFFMLSSHFVKQPGFKITLPIASTAQYQNEEQIIVYISQNNLLYFDEEEITCDDLLERLLSKIKESKSREVLIKADEKINLGLAVKVMDIAKQAEAVGVVISTRIEGENIET